MNADFIKRVKQLQKEMQIKQDAFSKQEFEVEKQGIKIVATGDIQIKSIDIDPVLIDPDDKELLEDLLIVTINALVDKINEEQDKIAPKEMPGGLPF
ncbi:YbaB/EbfC family nucleoid-associated protein [Mycoplasma sp. 6243]|uniref:YbaB/EbfC family nucleoid-associated protein n=1 Tax=Mycoplasma sp. 6243 TaxID=3440865 RepID=UPI003EC11450